MLAGMARSHSVIAPWGALLQVSTMSEDRSADPVQARKKAMDYLARREHGRAELVTKLEKAGFEPEISQETVARLVEEGLQSDVRFAEAHIASRIRQGKGPVRIRAELAERGMSASAIENGLEESGADWYQLAREVRARKFGEALPAEFPDKAKQMRFLAYRGFDSDQVQVAVSTADD